MLAAKASLREQGWEAMRAAKVARFPGAAGRIPNFTGAEAAAELLRDTPEWKAARTLKANPDSPQLPVALDPDHLSEPPRKAASITGATRSARRVALAELTPVDLVVMGSVAVGLDGARLGKGGGFADLEFAHDVLVDLIVTPTRVIDCRPDPRRSAGQPEPSWWRAADPHAHALDCLAPRAANESMGR